MKAKVSFNKKGIEKKKHCTGIFPLSALQVSLNGVLVVLLLSTHNSYTY